MNTKARMYGKTDDGEKANKPLINTSTQSYHTLKSQENLDIHVPSLAYVKTLEQNLKMLLDKVNKLEQKMKQLNGANLRMRQHINHHNGKLGTIETDLNNKIDRREY